MVFRIFALSAAVALATPLFPGQGNAQTGAQIVTGIAQGDSLNVRSGPGSQYQDIGDLLEGEVVFVRTLDSSGRWAQIQYRGNTAWVSTRYLQDAMRPDGSSSQVGPNVVTGIAANDSDGGLVVRDGPGMQNARLGVLRNGTQVHVVQFSRNGRWAMIASGNDTGWVSARYLRPVPQQAPQPQPMPSPNPLVAPDGGPLPAQFDVTGVGPNDVLWVRSQPDATSAPVGNLAPDGSIVVTSMATADWAQVQYGQNIGYVNIGFLMRSTGGNSSHTQNGFPLGLTCRGTEPFWTLEIADDRTVTYTSLINGQAPLASLVQTTPAPGGGYPYDFVAGAYMGQLSQQSCSDGMSDTNYSMRLILTVTGQNGSAETLYGCCNMQ